MHSSESSGESFRVILSAPVPSYVEPAERFVRGFSTANTDVNVTFDEVPFDQLGLINDLASSASTDMIVAAVRGDEDGKIDTNSGFMQVALDSDIPFMVLRGGREYTTPTRIVVPLDGSSTAAQAIPLASGLARRAGLPVTFVMVIDPSRVIPAAFAYDPDAWGVINDLRQTAHWALGQAEDQLRRDGVEVEAELLYGPVNACLREIVGDEDIVVMTTHGSGRASMRKVGSVAERVLTSVPQPIVIRRAAIQGDVIVEGYEACSWVEPLTRRGRM